MFKVFKSFISYCVYTYYRTTLTYRVHCLVTFRPLLTDVCVRTNTNPLNWVI